MDKRLEGLAVIAALMLLGCTPESLRVDECNTGPVHDLDTCLRDARDPRWEYEEGRRDRAGKAASKEDKRRIECEALIEPELTECLYGVKSADTKALGKQ